MAKPVYSLSSKIFALFIGTLGWGTLIWAFITYPLSTNAQWVQTTLLAVFSVLVSAIGTNLPNTKTYISLEAVAYYAAVLSLNPAAVGLVAMLPIVRWRLTQPSATNWAFFRNAGQNSLMSIAAALVYQAARGEWPLHSLTLLSLTAFALAILTSRIIDDAIVFLVRVLQAGVPTARAEWQANIRISWTVEFLAYIPALVTALLYKAEEWTATVLWLGIFLAGAYALYNLLRTRTEADGQIAELRALNKQMQDQNAREAALAVRLGRAADVLAGSATRMAAALQEQHIAMTEVTATVEQLAQQAQYIAEAAGAVDRTSQSALTTAGQGQAAAAAGVAAMSDLESYVQQIHERMTVLESRSRLIGRTLQTINGIAGETHLLALNATIEAAGAGESGRRFHVVAGQVNALADQALRAAGDIGSTVRDIETATSDTQRVIALGLGETRRYTGQVDEARQRMEGILGAVEQASAMAGQIRQATTQQTQASTSVSDALREIAGALGTASREGAAVASAAERLRALAERLRQLDEPIMAGRIG
jgi:methyl-accepting chemotaxis protein